MISQIDFWVQYKSSGHLIKKNLQSWSHFTASYFQEPGQFLFGIYLVHTIYLLQPNFFIYAGETPNFVTQILLAELTPKCVTSVKYRSPPL